MGNIKPWIFQNKEINTIDDMPKGAYGFIYEVTHLPTQQKYLGKKVLFYERNKKLGKKEQQKIKEERKLKGLRGKTPSKKKVILESDWKKYYGSHNKIVELIKNNKHHEFSREILMFVPNKKMLTYYETKYLFLKEVIENNEKYLNTNISGHFYSKDFQDLPNLG